MHTRDLKRALEWAVSAAHGAGKLMRDNFRSSKRIDSQTQHDIKLELDRRSQQTIERILRRKAPDFAVLGEEGVAGDPASEYRWVIDPIDGTVNFTYGIPHCCVSIALQGPSRKSRIGILPVPVIKGVLVPRNRQDACSTFPEAEQFETLLGVVYDPFVDELWTGLRGGVARLNGRPIQASSRTKLSESIIAIGFAKEASILKRILPKFVALLPRVRKMRMMGAAALSMVYVATGRHDAYLEYGVRLWDIAAGGLILELAGGEFWRRHLGNNAFQVIANNGRVRHQIEQCLSVKR